MNRILLLEPNSYHGEVLPGLTKYFEDIGYVVDVYLQKKVYEEQPFCRYLHSGKLLSYNMENIREILSADTIRKYDFLVLSSMEYGHDGKIERFLDYIGFIPDTKYGVLGIYHTVTFIDEFKDTALLNEGRLFCLSEFQVQNNMFKLRMLNPHYFCNDLKLLSDFQDKRKFLVIGNAAELQILADNVHSLDQKLRDEISIKYIGGGSTAIINQIRLFIRNPIKHVDFIGRTIKFLKSHLKNNLNESNVISKLGRLCFCDMYAEIENTDFIIVMIDKDNPKHQHYLNKVTSGIFQIIIGFHKPCIIQKDVADVYGFTEQNSITYEKKNLCPAITRAIQMTDLEYQYMRCNLDNLEKQIYHKSLENLKLQISRLQTEMSQLI